MNLYLISRGENSDIHSRVHVLNISGPNVKTKMVWHFPARRGGFKSRTLVSAPAHTETQTSDLGLKPSLRLPVGHIGSGLAGGES
jgi:hypothetical protein